MSGIPKRILTSTHRHCGFPFRLEAWFLELFSVQSQDTLMQRLVYCTSFQEPLGSLLPVGVKEEQYPCLFVPNTFSVFITHLCFSSMCRTVFCLDGSDKHCRAWCKCGWLDATHTCDQHRCSRLWLCCRGPIGDMVHLCFAFLGCFLHSLCYSCFSKRVQLLFKH